MIGFLLDLETNEIKVSLEKLERTLREYVSMCMCTHTHVHKPLGDVGLGASRRRAENMGRAMDM